MLCAETAVIPARKLEVPGVGPATRLQLVPFQCSKSAWSTCPSPWYPTAQASLVERVTTPCKSREVFCRPEGISFHLVPPQCTVSGENMRLFPLWLDPTAQMSLAAWAEIAFK